MLFSQHVFGAECSREDALDIGLSEIKKKFPRYKENEPYQIQSKENDWLEIKWGQNTVVSNISEICVLTPLILN